MNRYIAILCLILGGCAARKPGPVITGAPGSIVISMDSVQTFKRPLTIRGTVKVDARRDSVQAARLKRARRPLRLGGSPCLVVSGTIHAVKIPTPKRVKHKKRACPDGCERVRR